MDIITLEQVVRYIEGLGNIHLQVQNVGIGSPWAVNAETERIGLQSTYPTLFISPIESSLEDNVIRHTIDLMVFDLQDVSQDREGQLQILSDTVQILSDIVKSVKTSNVLSLTDQPIRLEAFTERFADGCAGWGCKIEISVPSVLSDCMSPNKTV